MQVSNLSIDEKIDLVKGKGSWHTNDLGGKLPVACLSDGPHGLRAQAENVKNINDSIVATCFPTASAVGCSFDRELINQMAGAIAVEAAQAGVSVLLGPGINMKRSPLCGRNFEYFSEDPYLAGELAVEYVKAVQEKGVATSLKHFAGNSQETHRMTSNSVIDERALREIYLRAFEKVVKEAKPATVMASYNFLNGMPACENKWLLTDVLRGEWGYDGLVMSDWGACVDAGACIEAGMDLEMPDSHGNHRDEILSALSDERLKEESLDRAVKNVINLVEKYPAKVDEGLKAISDETLSIHSELARQISSQSAVLLKNEKLLPLNNPAKVVIIGELAEKMRVQGGGSSHINTGRLTNILEVFESEGVKYSYYKGYDSNSNTLSKKDRAYIEEALSGIRAKLEADSDIPILIFGGLTDKAEGEGYDRQSLLLPENQRVLYQKIQKITENVVYISFGGSVYDMSDIDYAKAILNMYLGGESVAYAAVDLLLGKCNPCGRLSESWPLRLEDTPCYKNFGKQNEAIDDVLYMESLFIGYRYYDTYDVNVRYPFGYGLSYTTFKYSNMKCEWDNKRVRVEVDVTNTGEVSGKETILIFVKNSENDLMRARRELRGFDKIQLAPGETKSVSILLDDRAFSVFDVKQDKYVTVLGKYEIEVSKAVGDVILSDEIIVDENLVNADSYSVDIKNEITAIPKNRGEFLKLYGNDIPDFTGTKNHVFSAKNSLSQMAPYSFAARLFLKIGKLAVRIMTRASLDDPEALMMYEAIAGGNIDTVCNQSGGFISKKMINRIIRQANKNKAKKY